MIVQITLSAVQNMIYIIANVCLLRQLSGSGWLQHFQTETILSHLRQ